MLSQLRPAFVLVVMFTIITGLAYPLAITAASQVAFPSAANGSLVRKGETVVGSALIGQAFTGDQWFHGRPSATGPDPYNGAATSGSNLGPTSADLIKRIKDDVERLKAENPGQPVPTDLVTASGSGVDPHISPAAALFQVPRIAKARDLPDARIRSLVAQYTEGRTFGILGEPRVNVLALNMALDAATGG